MSLSIEPFHFSFLWHSWIMFLFSHRRSLSPRKEPNTILSIYRFFNALANFAKKIFRFMIRAWKFGWLWELGSSFLLFMKLGQVSLECIVGSQETQNYIFMECILARLTWTWASHVSEFQFLSPFNVDKLLRLTMRNMFDRLMVTIVLLVYGSYDM